MAVIAEDVRDMKAMLYTLQRYLDNRQLLLNVNKTKIMVFSPGGRKSSYRESWKWKNENIEEVLQFKYLGYTFKASGKATEHIRDLKTNAKKKLGQVWGMGERLFPNNFQIRLKMYDSLVASGLMYGAEIFGFKEREDLEIPQRQFIKWTMGLDKCTKTEIILAESNRFPHYIEMAKRALTYEARISGGTNPILKECLRDRIQKRETEWQRERETFMRSIGWGREYGEVVSERKESIPVAINIYKDVFLQKVYVSLRGGTYDQLRTAGTPYYLRNNQVIARFRCLN
jgi:hypothetical protein